LSIIWHSIFLWKFTHVLILRSNLPFFTILLFNFFTSLGKLHFDNKSDLYFKLLAQILTLISIFPAFPYWKNKAPVDFAQKSKFPSKINNSVKKSNWWSETDPQYLISNQNKNRNKKKRFLIEISTCGQKILFERN